MPTVLRELPYFEEITEIIGPGIQEHANAYQIIVWVSVTPVEQFELPPTLRRFPAILDIGLNHNFAIAPVHLRAWAGLHWNTLAEEGVQRLFGNVPVPTRRAYLWLHPNQSGSRDLIDPFRSAVKIELNDGIAVDGNGGQVGEDDRTKTLRAPRLPLIGLRALTGAGCQLHLDCARRMVSLDTLD